MPGIAKAERREATRQRERYGQRGQAKWWHAVAQSQARRAQLHEERAMQRAAKRTKPQTAQTEN